MECAVDLQLLGRTTKVVSILGHSRRRWPCNIDRHCRHCNNIGWCTVFAGPHRPSAMIYILDMDTCYIHFTVQQMNDMTTSSDLTS